MRRRAALSPSSITEIPDKKVEVQLSSNNLAEDTKDNVDVYPGDLIIVSRAGIVYVVGDVLRPSGFLFQKTPPSVFLKPWRWLAGVPAPLP